MKIVLICVNIPADIFHYQGNIPFIMAPTFRLFRLSPLRFSVLMALYGTACAQTASPETGSEAVLPRVVVNASADASAGGLPKAYAGGQVARGGRLGMLGNVDNMDAPFSATTYTQALMQDQQARSVADVLQNDPTVRVARGFGNYQELYVIRGFPVNSDDLAYNGLFGLLPRQFVASELLERVEVLRGANAFVNGAAPGGGGIGGAVNLVPKRAPNDPLTEITAGVDNGGQTYVAADLARRFGPNNSNGVRLNLVRRNGATAIDDEHRQLSVAAIGLDHRNEKFRLSADVGFQEHKLDQARPSVNLAAGIPVPAAPDAASNFSQPWSYSNERDVFGTVRGEFDLNDNVTAWAAFGARHGREDNTLANPTVTDNAGATSTYRFDNARRDNVRTGELGIRARLRTGDIGHTLSASASAFRLDSRNAYATSNFAGFASNLYHPVSVAAPAADFLVGGNLADPRLTQRTELSSVAVADTLSLNDDRLLLTLGVRHQNIKESGYDYNTGAPGPVYDKSAFTPVAGIVFKPLKNLSLYANYAEALTRGPTAGVTAVNVGEVFPPSRSKQQEIGVKYDAGRFGGSIALFTTKQPMGIESAAHVFGIDGEQRNRGAELTVYGMPARHVRLLGGLTYLDAKQAHTAGGVNEGKEVIGAPHLQANLNAEWDVPAVSGLTLTGRAVHTASQYADAANTQTVPAWSRFDAGVRYMTTFGKQTVTLRGQVENLTNRNYWASAGGYPGAGYLVLGAPRTVSISATIDF
jgi:iron complex outermembrane receptor protein